MKIHGYVDVWDAVAVTLTDYAGENAPTVRVLEFVQQSPNTEDANACVCVQKVEWLGLRYAAAAVVVCLENL